MKIDDGGIGAGLSEIGKELPDLRNVAPVDASRLLADRRFQGQLRAWLEIRRQDMAEANLGNQMMGLGHAVAGGAESALDKAMEQIRPQEIEEFLGLPSRILKILDDTDMLRCHRLRFLGNHFVFKVFQKPFPRRITGIHARARSDKSERPNAPHGLHQRIELVIAVIGLAEITRIRSHDQTLFRMKSGSPYKM
ncbi:hypothetical protein [Rhizobium leguminosarum]|uniref:hypothetical protein n=1 Tax=Rhizobium leguminosarum TaxID=384 RepID=UPI001FEFB81E|nr:hypothetical protein [Rhizobium leguminosarum]